MKLAKVGYEAEKVKREVVAMGGINWSDERRDGDLGDSLNVSFRRWPSLTTRKGRTQKAGYEGIAALCAHGKLAAVRGTEVLLDGRKVGTVKAGEKRFAVVNTKLVLWPDMVYLDLEDEKVKPMGARVTLSERSCTFTDRSIETDTRRQIPAKEPTNEEYPASWREYFGTDRDYDFPYVTVGDSVKRTAAGWVLANQREMKISEVPRDSVMLMISGGDGLNTRWGGDGYAQIHPERYAVLRDREGSRRSHTLWYEVYECPLDNESLLDHFKKGDAVAITGAGENDREAAVIEEITDTKITFSADLFQKEGLVEGTVTVERKVPPLEFICESQNRLWGCEGHTIWASALGDPTNFYVNKGLSTDSCAIAVGTDGAFTGCVGYSEGVLFWKEDCLHKVLGAYPPYYEVHTFGVPGVKAGCDKSQVIISDILYYLGQRGVYAYGGGTPRLLSGGFGERRLSQGIGGSDGERYYLSAKEGDESHLLVYDPGKGLWLREDDTRVRDFARLGNALYFAGEDGKVWLIDGGGEEPEQEWMAQLAPLYETVAGRKRYSRLLLRLELPQGSWVTAESRCDDRAWMECGTVAGRSYDVAPMRIPFNRCDKFELRLRGKGPCAVLSVMREFTLGSER